MDILMGQKSTPEGIIKGAGAPDFIQPNAPFNPRALPRTAGYDRFLKDKDVFSLGIKYINTAAKDIINTDIISNMKVHAKFFKDIGLDHASEALLKVAAEKFAGKPTAAQKFFDSLPRPFSYVLAANRFAYRGMMKSIFPLNFVWNFMVQSNAAVMLPARVGYGNTVKALATWTDPVMRKAVQNTYVHMLKASSRNPQLHEMGALAERYRNLERETVSEKMSDQLNFMTRWVEKYCTDHAVAAGLEHGKQLGLKGRALLEYASDVGARTQGLNNFENLPSLLGSRDVKALAPLQTFYLEALNNVADIVLAEGSHFGRTKLQRTTSFAKLCATIYASNLITDAVIGRDTWGPMAFIPFGSFISMAMDLGDRYEAKPVPIGQMVNDFRKAARGVAYYDNWNDAYKFMAYWSHLPGGRSIWRHYQGIKAGEEGEVRDISGKTMFQVPPESALKSALVGPYGTKEGKEWIKKKDDRTIMETLLGGKEPSSGSSGGRHRRTRRSR